MNTINKIITAIFIITAACILTCGPARSTEVISNPDTAGNINPANETRAGILYHAASSVPEDAHLMIRYPYDNPKSVITAAAVIGALILFDRPITKFYQFNVEKPLRRFRLPDSPVYKIAGPHIASPGPDGWLQLATSSAYIGGLAFNDPKAQKAGLMSLKAMTYSIVVSQVLLKSIFARKRPISWQKNDRPDKDFTDDPYAFWFFHKPSVGETKYGSAMPSFHLTMYFAAARVFQNVYDNSLIPYSFIALCLASHIEGHKHWVSDMVAGALAGTAIGTVVSRNTVSPQTIVITPYFDGRNTGMRATYNF